MSILFWLNEGRKKEMVAKSGSKSLFDTCFTHAVLGHEACSAFDFDLLLLLLGNEHILDEGFLERRLKD